MEKIKYFFKSLIGVSFFILFLFISSGKVNYIQGWIYFFINVIGLFLNIITIPSNDDLIKERQKTGDNIKDWDKKILGISALFTIISYIVAGLDSGRFHWSPEINIKYSIFGAFIVLIGQIIFLVAKSQNNFFSSVARIQTERNHSVCNNGFYKVVRHPGYIGMIISWVGFPIVMTSIYSLVPVIISIILIVLRTNLEDKMLEEELVGYDNYSQEVKYKLIPYIW